MSGFDIKPVKELSNRLKLPRLLLTSIPFRCCIVGRSQLSGKSTIVYNLFKRGDMLRGMFEPENIFFFNPTTDKDEKMLKLLVNLKIPEENVFTNYDEQTVEELFKMIEDEYEECLINSVKMPHYLFIFDDCGNSLRTDARNNIIDKISILGRHLNISYVICVQKYSQLSTTIRENLTNLICFGCTEKQRKLICEDNCCDCSHQQFEKMFMAVTKPAHSFLHINYHNSPEERYSNNFKGFIKPSDYE